MCVKTLKVRMTLSCENGHGRGSFWQDFPQIILLLQLTKEVLIKKEKRIFFFFFFILVKMCTDLVMSSDAGQNKQGLSNETTQKTEEIELQSLLHDLFYYSNQL